MIGGLLRGVVFGVGFEVAKRVIVPAALVGGSFAAYRHWGGGDAATETVEDVVGRVALNAPNGGLGASRPTNANAAAVSSKPPYQDGALGATRPTMPILLMAGGIVFLPIVAFPGLKRVMRKESNAAVAVALAAILAADAAAIDAGLSRSGGYGWWLFSGVLAASLVYDLFMFSYAQLRGPEDPAA